MRCRTHQRNVPDLRSVVVNTGFRMKPPFLFFEGTPLLNIGLSLQNLTPMKFISAFSIYILLPSLTSFVHALNVGSSLSFKFIAKATSPTKHDLDSRTQKLLSFSSNCHHPSLVSSLNTRVPILSLNHFIWNSAKPGHVCRMPGMKFPGINLAGRPCTS